MLSSWKSNKPASCTSGLQCADYSRSFQKPTRKRVNERKSSWNNIDYLAQLFSSVDRPGQWYKHTLRQLWANGFLEITRLVFIFGCQRLGNHPLFPFFSSLLSLPKDCLAIFTLATQGITLFTYLHSHFVHCVLVIRYGVPIPKATQSLMWWWICAGQDTSDVSCNLR